MSAAGSVRVREHPTEALAVDVAAAQVDHDAPAGEARRQTAQGRQADRAASFGQLAIVALFLPAAFLARRHPLYRRLVFAGGSLAIALVASLWMLERIFDLKIL